MQVGQGYLYQFASLGRFKLVYNSLIPFDLAFGILLHQVVALNYILEFLAGFIHLRRHFSRKVRCYRLESIFEALFFKLLLLLHWDEHDSSVSSFGSHIADLCSSLRSLVWINRYESAYFDLLFVRSLISLSGLLSLTDLPALNVTLCPV